LSKNINTTQAQQKALVDALVAPTDRLEFGKCNMRLDTNIKPKEATFQVVIDALTLIPFYQAFLITAEVPTIYMQEFWATVSVHKSLSIDLGHSGDIIYLTYVSVDYLHQPWRAFATIINKCLSGKETGMDKIRLSRAQILWVYFKKEQDVWHTARDETMFTSMRCISRHEDTQVYGDEIDFESKVPNEKHLKTIGADEGTGTILGVLDVPMYEFKSEKESWGDSEEEDEDDENDYVDKSNDDDDDNDDGDDDDDSGSDDHDDDNADERTKSGRDEILDPNLTNSHNEENIDDEERMDEEEEDEVTKEMYDDVNVNLGNEDTEMTNKADEPVQSSFVSSNFTSKLLNLKNPSPADNEIASLMDTTARHATAVPEITSSFTITIPPPPPFFNPLLKQATPTPTPTTSEATTSFPSLLDFSSIFRFTDRVTNLEKDLSELKQVDQYTQAISSIPAIVD
nr:hypothetical protein [Tanacetum cinerariifolium]